MEWRSKGVREVLINWMKWWRKGSKEEAPGEIGMSITEGSETWREVREGYALRYTVTELCDCNLLLSLKCWNPDLLMSESPRSDVQLWSHTRLFDRLYFLLIFNSPLILHLYHYLLSVILSTPWGACKAIIPRRLCSLSSRWKSKSNDDHSRCA